MHNQQIHLWQHDHSFDQGAQRPGERPMLFVIALTAVTMVVEVVAGLMYGSMALLADGLHMASHAVALGISFAAYIYVRARAHDRRFSFGTGKVNSMAGFASALLLAVFAFGMVWESVDRFFNPTQIVFNQAIVVAIAGLIVNGVSMAILARGHDHSHHAAHGHHHDHGDHNLKSAYLHVLADALTSVLAIGALLSGKFLGLGWMDPLMGIIGAILIARWAVQLIMQSGGVLLDRQVPEMEGTVREALERDGDDRVADLHIWEIGPNIRAAALSIVTHDPKSPEFYKKLLPASAGIVHSTVEVHRCRE